MHSTTMLPVASPMSQWRLATGSCSLTGLATTVTRFSASRSSSSDAKLRATQKGNS